MQSLKKCQYRQMLFRQLVVEPLQQQVQGSGEKFTQGECILYHELKLEVFR